jgi:hypothetical protein
MQSGLWQVDRGDGDVTISFATTRIRKKAWREMVVTMICREYAK